MKKLKLPLALAAFLSWSNLAALPQSETQDPTPEEESEFKEQPSDQSEVKASAVQHTLPAQRLNFSWDRGLHIDLPRDRLRLKVAGRILADATWISEDGVAKDSPIGLGSGTEFRSARLYVSGTFYEEIGFKVQYDFVAREFKNIYIDVRIPHVGTLRAGNQRESFGLESLTSLKHITFIERALPNGLDSVRNNGLRLSNTLLKERMTWAFGGFRETRQFSEGSASHRNFSSRVTGLLWYGAGGQQLLHLGIGYSLRFPAGDLVRAAQKPESNLTPNFVDTGIFPADRVTLMNSEAAWVQRRWSLQGEYKKVFVRSNVAKDPRFSGAYVQFSVFLTGESRTYNPRAGIFELIEPLHSFEASSWGQGAWELALRYSTIDLNDKDILGGELEDVTLGLNWYLNSSARVTLNYVHSQLKSGGSANILMTRLQIAF